MPYREMWFKKINKKQILYSVLELLLKYFIIFEETIYGRVDRSKFPNFIRFPCYLSSFLNSIKPRRDSQPEIDYTLLFNCFKFETKLTYSTFVTIHRIVDGFVTKLVANLSVEKESINPAENVISTHSVICAEKSYEKYIYRVFSSLGRPICFQGCARLMRTMLPHRFHKYSTFARHQYNPQINSFAAVFSIYPVN